MSRHDQKPRIGLVKCKSCRDGKHAYCLNVMTRNPICECKHKEHRNG